MKKALELVLAAVFFAIVMIIFVKQGAGDKAVITLTAIAAVIVLCYIGYRIRKKMALNSWLAANPDVSRVFLMYVPGFRKVTYVDVYSVDRKEPKIFGSNYSTTDRGFYLKPGMHMVEVEAKVEGNWFQGQNRNYAREVLEIEVGVNETYRIVYDEDKSAYYLNAE